MICLQNFCFPQETLHLLSKLSCSLKFFQTYTSKYISGDGNRRKNYTMLLRVNSFFFFPPNIMLLFCSLFYFDFISQNVTLFLTIWLFIIKILSYNCLFHLFLVWAENMCILSMYLCAFPISFS